MVNDLMEALRSIVAILVLVAAIGCHRETTESVRKHVCASNLLHLEDAKQQWCLEKHKTTNDVPVMTDLTNYMIGIPVCPDGGTYTLGPVWKDPTCSIKGHELHPSNVQ